MTMKQAKANLKTFGYTVNKTEGGDYRVGCGKAGTYHTPDLEDAVATGRRIWESQYGLTEADREAAGIARIKAQDQTLADMIRERGVSEVLDAMEGYCLKQAIAAERQDDARLGQIWRQQADVLLKACVEVRAK